MSDRTRPYESMTDEERSDMWKEAIKRSLTEVQELRERPHPAVFTSPLWGEYRRAYDDALEQVAFLFCPEELVPDMNKIIQLDWKKTVTESTPTTCAKTCHTNFPFITPLIWLCPI